MMMPIDPIALVMVRLGRTDSREEFAVERATSMAKRLGYRPVSPLVISENEDWSWRNRLISCLQIEHPECLVVLDLQHVDNEPDALTHMTDIVTVSPEQTYSRPLGVDS